MLVKILGIIDLIAGLILIISISSSISQSILIFFGFILLIKSSFGLLKDFASWIDLVIGLIFLISIVISLPTILIVIIAILIVQKGIASFL